jgi:hypothetical protein
MLKLELMSEDVNELQLALIKASKQCYFLAMDSVKKRPLHPISQGAIDAFIARDTQLVKETCIEAKANGESADSVCSSPRYEMVLSSDEIRSIVDGEFDKEGRSSDAP